MAASYPGSIKIWTPVTNNLENVDASHINGAYEEIIATEIELNATKVDINAIQAEVDVLVVAGDSSVEAAQARVNANAYTFDTLKARLDNSDELVSNISVNVKSYGATGDGITDDTVSIQSALTDLVEGETLYFPQGTFLISSTLTFNKKMQIKGEHISLTAILNQGIADAIILNATDITISNICVIGNVSSKNGIVINGLRTNLYNVRAERNGEHGIKLNPNIWDININNVVSFNNWKSGIFAVSSGDAGQINAVNINQSLLWANKEHGLVITGTRINVTGCNIEGNYKNGILAQTNLNNIFGLLISGNYIEANLEGNILFDLYPSLSKTASGIKISNNFLSSDSTPFDVSGFAMIRAITDTSYKGLSSICITKDNHYYSNTDATFVSLGNSIGSLEGTRTHCIIETTDAGNTTDYTYKYRNLGGATILHYQNTLVLLGYFIAKGITYTNSNLSDNIQSTLATTIAQYPINLITGNLIKKIGTWITTNSTNYRIQFTVKKINLLTGDAATDILYQDVANQNGSKYVTMTDVEGLTLIYALRIYPNYSYYLEIKVIDTAADGTNFQIGNPQVTYYV